MDQASKILSDVISFRTYAKFLPHANRRETFQETVNRCMNMHLDKFPHLSKDIIKAFEKVHGYEIMPAMRSLQFSGDAIKRNNLRSYNCFARDTSFITKEGVKSFFDFNDGDTLTVLTHLGNWKPATVKSYGKQTVVPITIKRGKSKKVVVKATENHRWILDSGKEVTAIREGDYLLGAPTIFNFDFDAALDEEKLYWCYGYVFGDGTLSKNKAKVYDRSMVRLCGDQVKFENRFLHCGFKSSTSLSLKGDIIVFTGKYLKTVPDPSVDSPNLIQAFVRGYLDADGAKAVSQTCLSDFRYIQATGRTHIEAIKKLFPIAGVYFTGFEEDKTDQVTNFGPRTDTTFRFGISTNVRNTSNAKFTVVSIERQKAEETDVWCLEVEDDASFVLSCGVSTGNCSYSPIDNVRAFGEVLFLLLSGCGVGFSVQKHHTKELPFVKLPKEEGVYTVHDSIEGWAQALDQLVESYFYKRVRPIYDFNNVRQKGAYLSTTGAKAPGPEPLKHMLNMVEFKLKKAIGRQLTPIEVHDIICIVSDAVISGGIRRSSLISLFDRDDEDMLKCKYGEWWNTAPWRARANNSVVLPREAVTKEEFDYIFGITQASGSGEPGFMWTNNPYEYGCNPSLRKGTRLWTSEYGIIPIEELENKTFTVKNLNGNLSKASCWLSGKNKPLYKITLTGGFTYYATAEHKWPVYKKGQYIKVETKDLTTDMKLARLPYQDKIGTGNLGTYEDGLMVGFFLGDGWITKRKDTGKVQYGVCIASSARKLKYLHLFEKLFNGVGSKHKNGNTIEFNSTGKRVVDFFQSFGVFDKEHLPEKIWSSCTDAFIDGFIVGLFDADGTYGEKDSNRLSICSKSEVFVREIQEFLGFKGIYLNYTFVTYSSYTNGKKVYEKAGSRHILRRNFDKAINGVPAKIISVELTDLQEDVWDINVQDETHCFQLGGCVTGNCAEISLENNNLCNLTTINQTSVSSKKDFLSRIYSATLIGTLQASYTDFPYVRDRWRRVCEEKALLGVSFTGIGDREGTASIPQEWLEEGARYALEVNEKYAKKLGINKAARLGTVKPEGTSSLVCSTSSGVHARHAPYYLRRIRMPANDALALYLKYKIPELMEEDKFSPNTSILVVPQKSPSSSIYRDQETALTLFDRTIKYNKSWVRNTHREGANYNNVSVTISVKDDEWDSLREKMWEEREFYTGISLLPFDGGTYVQAPFEECTEQLYNERVSSLHEIDLKEVREDLDMTDRSSIVACGANGCEIT